MVAINKITLPGCAVEGCGGETGTCTDSRVHHRNAENRAPVTRNHRSAPLLGRWLTRDPIGYRGGIALYEYACNAPTKRADPRGLQSSPAIALTEAIAAGDAAEVRTILQAAEDILPKNEVKAAEDFLTQNAKCVAAYAAYKTAGAKCRNCDACTTKAQAEENIVCFTAEIADRTLYLKLECDYVLAGSIARGSAEAAAGHKIQLAGKSAALAKCVAKATSLSR